MDNIFESFINNKEGNSSLKDKEKTYKQLDFMKHRNILSKIIKSDKIDKIHGLKDILEKYDICSLTKTFHNFITDRNKYVHGIIKYWASERKTILEYEVNGVEEYAEVNKDILNSFIVCYKDLKEFLMEVENTLLQ